MSFFNAHFNWALYKEVLKEADEALKNGRRVILVLGWLYDDFGRHCRTNEQSRPIEIVDFFVDGEFFCYKTKHSDDFKRVIHDYVWHLRIPLDFDPIFKWCY